MIRRQVKRILCMAIMSSVLTGQGVFARDSQFTRQGAGPMYWISYEHQYTKNTYMPENRFKANIDWMAENFLPYGYDMVSTDGWIEGATMLNRNGYVLSHNDHWITNPLDMSGKEENVDSVGKEGSTNSTGKVINGDFEDGETGWNFEGQALHGINGNEQDAVNSLYTWKWEPHDETISQTVNGLSTGKYRISAKAKTKNGMSINGSIAVMRIKGYDASKAGAVDETPITSEQWTTYTREIDVTSGSIDLEFYYDSKGTNSAGLDLDDIKVEPIIPGQSQPAVQEPSVEEQEWQYPEDKYPNGHTWKFWADYAKNKGLKYGVYYNPLWVSPEVVKHPDKYTVVGHPEIKVSDLIIKDPNGSLKGGDRFNGGQGSERALYWLNVDAPGAEDFVKGYVNFFKNQGVKFLRVDFLSWYETPSKQGISGIDHTREQYEKALKWMSEAAGKDMILSLVMPNLKDHGELERKYGDMIRIDEDVFGGGWDHTSGRRQEWNGENWSQWASAFQGLTGFSDIDGRGSLINDADFTRLNTFNGKYADNERKSEVSLYTIAGAPITIADEYDTIGDNAKFYQNTELIELNKIGLSGKPIFNDNAHYKDNKSRDSERWVGQLPDGSYVVGLFNRSDEQKTLNVDFDKDLGINQGTIRDLWAHKDLGTKKSYTAVLDPHDCTIIKIVPAAQDKKYQAEVASYEGAKFNGSDYINGAQFNNNRIGYTGTGFIENIATSDDKVTFAVNAPSDGNYKFKINYANNQKDALIDFYSRNKESGDTIDTKEVPLPTTNDLGKWKAVKQSLNLKKGINLITVQGKAGSINLDSIEMLATSEATIVNGDFENGTTGWTKDGDGWFGADSNDAYEGNKLYNYFSDAGESTINQTINNVADGHYKVTVMAKLMPYSYPNFEDGICQLKITQPGLPDSIVDIKPKVKDGVSIVEGKKIQSNEFEYVPYTVEADVTAGKMNIEFHTKAPKGDTSLQLDDVKIEKINDGQQINTVGNLISNSDFKDGFESWSRNNMVNQSIKKENDNSYVEMSGAYNSELWQYVVPGLGNYAIKAKVRNHGDFDESSLYVNYSGGTKKITIPKSNEWTTVTLPNISVQSDEVIKLGALLNGKAGSSLDIDNIELVKSDPKDYEATTSLGNLSTENPYTVDGNGVIFNFDKAPKVKVDFMSDEIARVWMEPTGIFNKDKSFVINNESAKVTPTVTDVGDYIKVSTSALTVRAYKSPFRIEYYDAANTNLITGEAQDGGLKYDGDTGIYETMNMGQDEHFYGLGMDRDSKTLDRAGQKVIMKNNMVGGDTSGNVSDISGTFFTSTRGYGIFFDNTYEKTTFDMGATNKNQYSFSAPNGEMVYYFINGSSLDKIMENYSQLSGKAPLPPKWTLGYIQSKYGYKSWDEVNQVVDKFREKGIPVDGIVLDAYWAENNHYFDMTWADSFKNPKETMDGLAKKGIKMTTIVDPYIQVTSNLFVEGDKNGYFVKDSSGNTIIYDAWYGKSGLIDYTNPDAAKWYTSKVKQLNDEGVKGWWIDLNEPEKATDSLRDQFKEGNAAKIRNTYALNEAKAFYDGQRSYTNERVWSLARSGFSGIQKYGTTVWSGDMNATWDAFTQNLELGLSTGMSGIPYFTNDTGGFREGPPSAELYTRWMQAASFMPIFRAHGDDSADNGAGEREPWAFGKEVESIVTDVIKQRYRLLPYIYTMAQNAHKTNIPIMRPLILDYVNDSNVDKLQDQWMFGNSMMIAPVHTEGATSRNIYLPQGTWYDWNDNTKEYTGGNSLNYYAPLGIIPVFVKEGSIVPEGQDVNYVGEKPDDYINLKVYPNKSGEETKFSLYEDDGNTYSYENNQSAITDITVKKDNETLNLNIGAIQGDYERKVTGRVWAAQVKVDSLDKAITSVKRNNVDLTQVNSIDELNGGNDVWYYDSDAKTVYLRTSKVPTDLIQNISISAEDVYVR